MPNFGSTPSQSSGGSLLTLELTRLVNGELTVEIPANMVLVNSGFDDSEIVAFKLKADDRTTPGSVLLSLLQLGEIEPDDNVKNTPVRLVFASGALPAIPAFPAPALAEESFLNAANFYAGVANEVPVFTGTNLYRLDSMRIPAGLPGTVLLDYSSRSFADWYANEIGDPLGFNAISAPIYLIDDDSNETNSGKTVSFRDPATIDSVDADYDVSEEWGFSGENLGGIFFVRIGATDGTIVTKTETSMVVRFDVPVSADKLGLYSELNNLVVESAGDVTINALS